MDSPRVVHVASEAYPLAKSGGLGDVVGALPGALRRIGQEPALFLPAYPWIRAEHPEAVDLGLDLEVPTGDGAVTGRLLRLLLPASGVPVFLFRADALFDRRSLYGDNGGEYPDNAYRFGVFCRAVLRATQLLGWSVDVFHLHDWQAALLAVFLRTEHEGDPQFARTRTVLSIHNLAYQGWAAPDLLRALRISSSLFHHHLLECHGLVNLLKGGIVFADHVTTVSPHYAEEILRPEMGWGLDGVLRTRAAELTGILNGADPAVWSPATDPYLAERYDVHSWPEGKAAARRVLADVFGFRPDDDRPLVGFIGRLTGQKGVDLLLGVLPELIDAGARLVLIGTGDPNVENAWRDAARSHAGSVAVQITYDETLAHLIQAAADMLVMPSRFEPCGLNQLYAMRYGTVPIVHAVGGLLDTVVPATPENLAAGTATGFHFESFSWEGLGSAFRRALALHGDRDRWAALVETGMRQDFTWERSARAYGELYARVLGRAERHMPLKLLPQFPRPAEPPRAEDEHVRLLAGFRRPHGEPALGLLVQSATVLFAYWEIPPELRAEFGPAPRLELEDLTGGGRQTVSVAHPHQLGDYWFHVHPDHTYRAEIVSADRHRHLVSEPVRTPRNHPSFHWATDDAAVWVTLDELSGRARKAMVDRYLSLLELTGLRWRTEVPAAAPSLAEAAAWVAPAGGVPSSVSFGPGPAAPRSGPPGRPPAAPPAAFGPSSAACSPIAGFGSPPLSDFLDPGPGEEGSR
ncbi:MAG: glycogen synthase GlgA [Planctomycetes bacterium]|nr:glycogen synthase GlgA [Planctomycetota bacterium]